MEPPPRFSYYTNPLYDPSHDFSDSRSDRSDRCLAYYLLKSIAWFNKRFRHTHTAIVCSGYDRKKGGFGKCDCLKLLYVNGARLIGPSVAGMLIATLGEGMCFLLNGLSFIAVIFALLAMKITPKKREAQSPKVFQGLKEGFSYAFGFAPIRSVLLLLGLVSLMGMPFTVLMPIFAEKILHGGPQALGFLSGATGVGAIAGSIYLASRKSVLGLGRIIVISSNLFGIGLIGFSLSRLFWLSLLMMLLTGFGMMVEMASSNTVLQTIVEEDKRGRRMITSLDKKKALVLIRIVRSCDP